MAPKNRKTLKETRNLPIPLALFTSYIAAEKSDELIKVFCKELPGILKNINDSKKALESRSKVVYKLKESIKVDLKKLELAILVLKELNKEEEELEKVKEKDLLMLRSQISDCGKYKNILKSSLLCFCDSKKALDEVAVESKQYENALVLVPSYLTLVDMNEKILQDQTTSKQKREDFEDESFKLEQKLLKLRYDAMTKKNKLDALSQELNSIEINNYNLGSSLEETTSCERQKHIEWIHFKRWAFDICQRIGVYKDGPLPCLGFIKLISEIEEFVGFSRNTLLKLEQTS